MIRRLKNGRTRLPGRFGARRRVLLTEPLENRALLAANVLQNPVDPLDVNADGYKTPLDALVIFNELNLAGVQAAGEAPGQDQMYMDVNGDTFISPIDALYVLNELNAEGEDHDLVRIRLQVVDTDENPIDSIGVDQDFFLQGYVTDLTGRVDGGVFAAYADVEYDSGLVSVSGEIVHVDPYLNQRSGDTTTPGLIDEVGAFDGFDALGPSEFLFFSVPMTATTSGVATFVPSEADNLPSHEVLVYGDEGEGLNGKIPPDRISFESTTLQVGTIDVPIARDDLYNAVQNEPLVVESPGVLENDEDPQGGSLTATLQDDPSSGMVELNSDGSFTYTPNQDFSGVDTFTYVANSVGAMSNVATVQIIVEGINRAPVAVDDEYSTPEGTPLDVEAAGVLINDSDPDNDPITAQIVSDPLEGTLTLQTDGSFVYEPNVGFTGTDSFTYMANDGELDSNVATVTITVEPINRAPIAVDDQYSTDEDTPLEVEAIAGVLINDSDPDDDPITAQIVTDPLDGTVTLQPDGSFVYEPDADFFGTDSFTYVANDGELDSNVATVTITVNPSNDRPIANPDFYMTQINTLLQVSEEDGVLANDSDPDGDLTAELISDVSDGVLTLNDDGSFEYMPNEDFAGEDTFTYVAFDGELSSDETLVTITVSSVNSLVNFRLQTANLAGDPISSIAPGGEFLVQAYMEDLRQPAFGIFAAYMDILYDSNLVSANGDFEDIVFNDIYDGQRTGDLSQPGIAEEVGAFDGLDPVGPGEFFLFSIPFIAGNQEGQVEFASDGAEDQGHDVLLYNLNETVPLDRIIFGATELEIVAGDPPVAVDDEYETLEDTTLNVSAAEGVLANDVDPDGDTLTAVLVNSTINGTLKLNLDGSFTYDPDPNFFGVDSFTYQASDGANLSNVANVRIDVISQNDAPIAVDDFYRTDGETLIVEAPGVLENDIEVEGETLTAVQRSDVSNGLLVFNSDGSFTYTPNAGFVGRDSFSYWAEANDQQSNPAIVNIDVGDLSESSISGYVYFDTNNDGQMDPLENRLGGVELTLSGVDLLGNEVLEVIRTGGDGSYQFSNLLSGQYALTESQPMYLIDGMDTLNGVESVQDDLFLIDLPAGADSGDYNFGERGLEPQFINNTFFFASRELEGLLAMVDEDGQSQWYSSDNGWQYFDPISVELSANLTTAVIQATEPDGFVQSSSVRVLGNHDVTLTAGEEGYIVRFKGEPEVHGLDASAVDAVFGGDV